MPARRLIDNLTRHAGRLDTERVAPTREPGVPRDVKVKALEAIGSTRTHVSILLGWRLLIYNRERH